MKRLRAGLAAAALAALAGCATCSTYDPWFEQAAAGPWLPLWGGFVLGVIVGAGIRGWK